MSTTFMGLTLPTPSVTLGPVWASELNTALTSIDSHDHTTGSGNQVPAAGININADLSFGDFSQTEVGASTYNDLAALLTANNTMYVKDGDWFMNDGSGNQVRITSGGALDVGSVGGIGGDYGTTAATVFYTDASLTYFFQDSASAPGKVDCGDIACEDVISSTLMTTPTLTVSTSATIASAAITATTGTSTHAGAQIFSNTATFNAATLGYGIVPLGALIPVASNLTGSHTIPATGTMDASGWQLADGAAVSASGTLTGTTPDLSDNRFIMGATSSGTAAGANTINLQHSHTVDSHTHTISHDHSSGTLMASIGISSGGNIVMDNASTFTASNTTIDSLTGKGTNTSSYTGADVKGATAAASTSNSGGTSPGTDNSLSTTQSILPQYVTAQYLLRVK